MATLQIRKKSADGKVWAHIDSQYGEFIISKMYCKTDDGKFKVVEAGGSTRREYLITDITIYDDTNGGAAFTFTGALPLMNKLAELNYVGFYQPGQISIADYVSSIPGNALTIINGQLFVTLGGVVISDLISADPNNIIVQGTDGKLYAVSSGGQSYDGSNLMMLNPTTGFTSSANQAVADVYNATFQDEIISIGYINQVGAQIIIPSTPIQAKWRINNTIVDEPDTFTREIQPEAEGFQRFDIIVATVDGFEIVEGQPDNYGVAIQPATPDDTIFVSLIEIDGTYIGAPTQPVINVPGRGQNKILFATFDDFGVTAFSQITAEMVNDFIIAANVPDIENYKVIVQHDDAPILPSVLSFTMTDLETAVLPYNITDVNNVAQWNASPFCYTAGFADGDFDSVLIEGDTVTLTASDGSQIVTIQLDELPLTAVSEISGFAALAILGVNYSTLEQFEPITTGSNPTEVSLTSNYQLTQLPTTLNYEAVTSLAAYACAFTETSINAFLIARRNEGVTGKEYNLTGENSAYPTGDGITALNDLLAAGNSISVNEAP